MARKKQKKVEQAMDDLAAMIAFYEKKGRDETAAFLALVKAFEVAVEYGWKELKRRLEEKGVDEAFAPKDIVRKAAQVGLIDDAEGWLDFIDARNESVHDYYGMTESEYVKLARAFLKDARKVLG